MGNFTSCSCLNTSDEEPSASPPASPSAASNSLKDSIYKMWKKIEEYLDKSCICEIVLTKERLKIWCVIYITSNKFYNQNGLYFPFKKVALRVVKRYKFMILHEKKRKGPLTSEDSTSLKAISLELTNEIKKMREICKELNELEQNYQLPTP